MAPLSNIILLTIDCLRFDCLTKERMPNLYSLSQEGTNYVNAYTEHTHTVPSFQSLWESEWIIELKNRGYYTIGINYNGWLSKLSGYDFGFDFWHDAASYKGPIPFIDDSKDLHTILFEHIRNGIHEPFFIWLHYMDVHTPYYPHKWDPIMLLADVGTPLIRITPEIVAEIKNRYYFAAHYIDENLGILFDFLKLHGYYDQSLIIVSADHGELLYEHGKFGHGEQHEPCEELCHIPLVVKNGQKLTEKKKILFKDIAHIILNNPT